MSDAMAEPDHSARKKGFFGFLRGLSAERPKRFVSRYVQVSDNLFEENRLLRLVAGLAFFSTAILAAVVMMQAQKTRVIVAPFGAGVPDLLIVGDKPSQEYIAAIARNVVSLTGTFTASSAEFQFNEVLRFVHPSVYDSMREEWKEMVEGLRQYREVSFATYVLPQKPIEIYGDRIQVAAQRSRFIGDKVGEETGFVEIGYVIENSRFWITSVQFKTYGGRRNAK